MGQKKQKLLFIWLVLLFVFITGLLLHTRCRIECVRIGYEITQRTEDRKKLFALQNELKIELATLKNPHHIEEQIARYKLGLKTPTPKQIIQVP